MDSLEQRLRAERERLGLSQSAFGEIGGVQKRAQINYEAGERQPDAAYLAAIAAAGADVLYILTGQRAGAAPVAPALTREEEALLDDYRHCPPDARRAIKATSGALAKYEGCCMTKKKGGKAA
jgi:transcriptional regulator with XRE-family HTH domain